MSVAIITGSSGLIGSEAAQYFAQRGMKVVGIDNDMRSYFFGQAASTGSRQMWLQSNLQGFETLNLDIRDREEINKLFSRFGSSIKLVIHAAAQPSHDWAAREPFTDFDINATGTLNMLEACRRHASDATFIYTSTNKVYGDLPNQLPLTEARTRWQVSDSHRFAKGIDESMSIDQSTHSLFGVSKAAADLMVQEYGRYFGMKTACFRGGCLAGPNHSGAQLHGFLSYLVYCGAVHQKYTVYGYKGKQVRDNIHSFDLIKAFDAFFENPRYGEVYNIGGGSFSNCSILEAIRITEEITGKDFKYEISNQARIGDHQWYISDMTKFKTHYPQWKQIKDLRTIIQEIFEANREKWCRTTDAA